MRVIGCHFIDLPGIDVWVPEDPYDIDLWISVTVGDDTGGTDFQIHLCTPISIRHIRDKRHCFMIDQWIDEQDLERRLNQFIQRLSAETTEHLPYALARHWHWEYGPPPARSMDR